MAWTFQDKDGTQASGSSTTIATPGMTVAAGDLVVVWVSFEGADTTISVSDGTSSLTADPAGKYIGPVDAGFDPRCQIFYLFSSVASGTNSVVYTATFGAARAWRNITAMTYTPAGTVSVDAASAGANGKSTAAASGNITTTTVDGLAFGFYGEYGQVPSSQQINATAADQIVTPFNNSQWSKTYSTGFTGQATTTISQSDAWVCATIAFKAVAGGGGTILPQMLQHHGG